MRPEVPGSRIFVYAEDLGVIGESIPDPQVRYRIWTITNIFVPTSERRDLRARLVDQKGFSTFCNVGALERPRPEDLFTGEDDEEDDLHMRELLLTHQPKELMQRLHRSAGIDEEVLLLLLQPSRHICIGELWQRWARVERSKVTWTQTM